MLRNSLKNCMNTGVLRVGLAMAYAASTVCMRARWMSSGMLVGSSNRHMPRERLQKLEVAGAPTFITSCRDYRVVLQPMWNFVRLGRLGPGAPATSAVVALTSASGRHQPVSLNVGLQSS